MPAVVVDLLAFIGASPTPYHAVAEAARRLGAAGYRRADEAEIWDAEPGDRVFVTRNEGSLIAVQYGSASPATAGFRVVAAHTDSPNLRIKPRADVSAHGYRQLAVELYGQVLLHTWLDRDLSIAGRVALRDEGRTRTELLDLERPLARVPSLAIHLDRDVRTKGLELNAQRHALPLVGVEGVPGLTELVVTELRARQIAAVAPEDVLAFDLMLYDTQPPCVAGARGEFILAPRLDNLASCHAALSALLNCDPGAVPEFTRVVTLYDHEEVGSRSASGAAGTFLIDTLERAVSGFKGGEPQGYARASARSTLISCDMTHAVHPNYADRHEEGHRPVIGRGPAIKSNANQSYATDAVTAGMFSALCEQAGITPQHFVSRSDLPCGSTVGPISASRAGIRTLDIGSPMLSMHSCREMAGSADVEPMIEVLRLYLEGS